MSRTVLFLLAAVAAPATALQLPCARPAAPRLSRARTLRLAEDTPPPSTELSDEQIVATATKASEAAGGAESWPEAKPPPQVAPIAEDVLDVSDKAMDPRFIIYVSLPALVLAGQLFFTFSRDALGDAALGPAIMDDAPGMAMSRPAPAPAPAPVETAAAPVADAPPAAPAAEENTGGAEKANAEEQLRLLEEKISLMKAASS